MALRLVRREIWPVDATLLLSKKERKKDAHLLGLMEH
jgi:hypothetical protein